MNIMRGRTNSGVRLDYYHRIALKTIMAHQSPITGLFPASPDNNHAWIRDNVYTILSVWGLSMAYKKMADMDEDRAKSYELEQCCVKLMRGLLRSMMLQKEKVEKFKTNKNPVDSLHAKFSSLTGQQVVGDSDWGHLQIDAVSLYLLILAQMTAAGLQIIFNLDEVAFIQNLVFYIESAYCIPDYGIWERGDKANHGLPELNASSIGMAKAALEAMNELDLFGARGGPSSVIHVLTDEAQKCQAVLLSMLPRESSSKELDSGLLSIISYPAFAVDDPQLISVTREAIVNKLMGDHGCKRFLRDGYRTPKEDPSRLHYEPCELKIFENIECEWPLFFCYLIIDSIFQKNKAATKKYDEALDKLLIKGEDGVKLVPEMYAVRSEYASPKDRIPVGKCPFLWAQSLYILGKLLQDGFLAAAELDPLNRRLCLEKKPDVVVQVVILAENNAIKEQLRKDEIHVQTLDEVSPIEVQPARVLSHLYTFLGRNEKLGLSGRYSRDVGILCTSKLYSLQDKIFAFTPQSIDPEEFYMRTDPELLASEIKMDINFLAMQWRFLLGRPTYLIVASEAFIDDGKIPLAMITTMKKLKSGYINGTRVTLGYLKDFLNTSCVTNLSFLGCQELGLPDRLKPEVKKYLEINMNKCFNLKMNLLSKGGNGKKKSLSRRVSVKGAIKKTRSIIADIGENFTIRESSQAEMSPGPDSPPPQQLPWKSKKNWQSSSENSYGAAEVEELLVMLRETEHLEEQGDILQYLIHTRGMDHKTGIMEGDEPVTLRDLLKVLYEKACQEKLWGLVRHTAGILGKRVEDLAKAVTDLLVRQKQVTVGMGPASEATITAPLPETELRQLIHSAHGDDQSTAMLTQELLVYLAMFIRTEPSLFKEMLRLRVGLIIQVMAMELSRALGCSGEQASDHLLNLSPFQMKNLLHHIISGKEFSVSSVGEGNISILSSKSGKVSKKSQIEELLTVTEKETEGQQGQWLRRRRLDGALNRVPIDLYPRIWKILDKCEGLAVEGYLLHKNLTQEMTSGELKFALAVEAVLNRVPQPEYRQLLVEALMVLSIVAEHNITLSAGKIIAVENIVHKANQIFLKEQREVDGDATLCCASEEILSGGGLVCGGAAYVCQHFYDSAPSGSYGTITYLTKAVFALLDCFPREGELQCNPS